jgi:hypothetical protein
MRPSGVQWRDEEGRAAVIEGAARVAIENLEACCSDPPTQVR